MTDVIAVSAAAVILVLIISAVKKTEPGISGVLSVFLTVWLISVAASLALYFKNGLSDIGKGVVGEYLPYVLGRKRALRGVGHTYRGQARHTHGLSSPYKTDT